MPELPEVETICRGLRSQLVGRRILDISATVPSLRTPLRLDSLRSHCTGRNIIAVRRRGKYIIVELSDDRALVLHLGMTGAFRICPHDEPLAPHDRVVWTIDTDQSWRLEDVRRFASVTTCCLKSPNAEPDCLAKLGPEPLDAAFSGEFLRALCRGRKRPVKSLLMDQRVVAGVGNIYATEALFRAGLRPQRPSRSIGATACNQLVTHVKVETSSH